MQRLGRLKPETVPASSRNGIEESFARLRTLFSEVSSPRAAELAIFFCFSLALIGALLGSHVTGGGLYDDDFWMSAAMKFPAAHGFASSLDAAQYRGGMRPLAPYYWTTALDGLSAHLWLVRLAGLLLLASVATASFWLLRELRVKRGHAAAIATLALVCPLAYSTLFWLITLPTQIQIGLYLLGAIAVLKSFDSSGRRATVLSAAGMGLYVLSLLIAELMVPFVFGAGLLYAIRYGWRRVWRRAILDAAVGFVAGVHYFATSPTLRATDPSVHSSPISNGLSFVGDGITLILRYVWPPLPWTLPAVCLIVAVLATALEILPRANDPRRAQTRYWMLFCGCAALALAAAWAIYLPTPLRPTSVGIDNRVNQVALLPFSALLYGFAGLVAAVVPRRGRGRVSAGPIIAVVIVVMVGAAYVTRLLDSKRIWDRAGHLQRASMAALHQVVPAGQARGSTLIIVGAPAAVITDAHFGLSSQTAAAPALDIRDSLEAAVQLSYGTGAVRAFPISGTSIPQVACGRAGLYEIGLDGVRQYSPYGRVRLVDLKQKRAWPIDSSNECRTRFTKTLTASHASS